jgi:dTDP-4-dehydrorhamnose 3,5-epimerase-like enzyme
MKVTVEKIAVQSDSRGFVLEPLLGESLALQRNVHMAVTQPGAVRGNHYHRKGTEVLVLFGPCQGRLREKRAIKDIVVGEGEVSRFTIPAGVSHAFKKIGNQPAMLIAFNSGAQKELEAETIRDLLIE